MMCDWCGVDFVDGERTVPGYEDQPTHVGCRHEARKAWRQDQARASGHDMFERQEREPFTDWPNGQGTYD